MGIFLQLVLNMAFYKSKFINMQSRIVIKKKKKTICVFYFVEIIKYLSIHQRIGSYL
jgi:hypothetical protein